MSYSKKQLIESILIAPETCHCTTRHVAGVGVVEARSNGHDTNIGIGDLKATIHYTITTGGSIKLEWNLSPISTSFRKSISADASDDQIEELILEGCQKMHEQWTT